MLLTDNIQSGDSGSVNYLLVNNNYYFFINDITRNKTLWERIYLGLDVLAKSPAAGTFLQG